MRPLDTFFRSLNSLQVSAAILDKRGNIIAVNDSWIDFGSNNGLQLRDAGVGSNYLDFCQVDDSSGSQCEADLRRLLSGESDLVTFLYPCHSPTRDRWFFLLGFPLAPDQLASVVLLHINLSDVVPLLFANPLRPAESGTSSAGLQAKQAGIVSAAMLEAVADALSSQLSKMLTADKSEAPGDPTQHLSKRQIEVFRLLGQGYSNAEIAKVLLRSPHTIKLHVSAILQRLNLKSRTQAALLASKLTSKIPAPAAAPQRIRLSGR